MWRIVEVRVQCVMGCDAVDMQKLSRLIPGHLCCSSPCHRHPRIAMAVSKAHCELMEVVGKQADAAWKRPVLSAWLSASSVVAFQFLGCAQSG